MPAHAMLGRLDSLRADAVFGWRQLMKRKVTSAAAMVSLALAMGACASAFRLIDALLLRSLPVAGAERLYGVSCMTPGNPRPDDTFEYPLFARMRDAVKDRAGLIGVSYVERVDVSYGSDEEMEKANRQYVSGWMFDDFGIQAGAGRLLHETDDLEPGAQPVAALSYDYWTRRFGRDPAAIGRTFRFADRIYQIVGVAREGFTGTETGTVTDIFIPTMMHPGVRRSDWGWCRALVCLRPGATPEPVRQQLEAVAQAFEKERSKGFPAMPKWRLDQFINRSIVMESAAAGVSRLQRDYRRPLTALGVLVALILLIACANVANLMTAQAAARAREMALRVSLGAGRARLVQLVMVESAMLAVLAAAMGAAMAAWSAPFLADRINPPNNPARLDLRADWRVLVFFLALTAGVTFLFGLLPALGASSVKPAGAMKGGEDPRSRRRWMHSLVALQAAFCFAVLFDAGLLGATFSRLSHQPTGFSSDRVLALETVAQRPRPPALWDQIAGDLRGLPGVEAVAIAGFPLVSGNNWNGLISIDGAPLRDEFVYFLEVSPGFIDLMKIGWVAGRDLDANDTYPGAAVVNETFARMFFDGRNPVGRTFERSNGDGAPRRTERIVGVVRDARYHDMREANLPVAYVPFHWTDARNAILPRRGLTLMVRTASANPLSLAPMLRKEVSRAGPEFRVTNVTTQHEWIDFWTIRERLLAMLAVFFGAVALLLASVGMYGVLDYAVVERRREIGIRMAIGARASDIARRVTAEIFGMVLAGALAGVALGMASGRFLDALLYGVSAKDLSMIAVPALILFSAALLAALPAVIRAVRIDPVAMLRAE